MLTISSPMEAFVQAKIDSGQYGSASEVITEALCLLEIKEQLDQSRLNALRQAIQEGIDSGPSKPLDIEVFLKELQQELPETMHG